MNSMDIQYSFAKYIYENNPTAIQIGYDYLNFENGAQISESEEYINITYDKSAQYVLDSVGNKYVLKEFNIIVTLKYNKQNGNLFDLRERNFQRFIEGMDINAKDFFKVYNMETLNVTNKRIEIDYTRIKGAIVLYDDKNTKTMYWILPLKHSNR